MNEVTTICGFPVANGSSKENLMHIQQLVAQKFGGWLVTLNLEMLARANADPSYRQLLDQADYFIADGMPLVWASACGKNRTAGRIPERTTGVDLVDHFLRLEDIPNYAVIGGAQPVKTLDLYPGAAAACRFLFDGVVDLSETQVQLFAEEIQRNEVKVVFVALGVPKQDQMSKALRKLVPEVVYIGVGGTFSLLASNDNRAPDWMQASGLEWLFRLKNEPKRLWKRYLVQYPRGAVYLLKDTFLHAVDDEVENTPAK